jgi:signal transduction histidine kinase
VFDIKQETDRLDELTQNYLSLAGVTNLQCELTELSALIQTFAEGLQPTLATRGITLYLEGLDQLGKVLINYNAFRRALLNLAHNAIDAMTFGGRLTLRGGRECSMVWLEVQDTGNGIPETQRPLLFTPFHTSKTDGTGLGLFVAQQILTSHGGTLELTHSSERGTTFTLELPLAGTSVDDDRTNE